MVSGYAKKLVARLVAHSLVKQIDPKVLNSRTNMGCCDPRTERIECCQLLFERSQHRFQRSLIAGGLNIIRHGFSSHIKHATDHKGLTIKD